MQLADNLASTLSHWNSATADNRKSLDNALSTWAWCISESVGCPPIDIDHEIVAKLEVVQDRAAQLSAALSSAIASLKD